MKITLPQQSLNLLQQYLAQPGWARMPKVIYLGGRLLAVTLPELDLSWIATEKQLLAMTAKERDAYREKDQVWCTTPREIEISQMEYDTIKTCLEKLTEAGSLAPNKWNFPLFDNFGLKPD